MRPAHVDLNALAAYIDRRLSDDERQAMTGHLAECAECRATLAAYARGATRSSISRFRVWMSAAAAVILATSVGLLMGRSGGPVVPQTDSPSGQVSRDVDLPAPPSESAPSPDVRPQQPATTPSAPPDVSLRRGGERKIDGKTFRLVAGEWIDTAYDPLATTSVREVVGSTARASLLATIPALAKYADLGPRVLVLYEGSVYRFTP